MTGKFNLNPRKEMKMKKLAMMALAVLFATAMNSQAWWIFGKKAAAPAQDEAAADVQKAEKAPCCAKMTAEEKAACQEKCPAKKAECTADKKAACEAKQAECKAKKAECKAAKKADK